MKRILVTGATGSIGLEVIHCLIELNSTCEIIAAVRHIEKAKRKIANSSMIEFREFDFEQVSAFNSSFDQIDILFLLRPPHISNVEKYFKPLLISAKEKGVKNIIFLSVQGVERSKVIPHNKIENLIKELDFNYIFVRPSYFMQNLTTALLPEIINNKSITLPSADAKFNWIDVKNIGELTAYLIIEFEKYQNQAYDITGMENKSFDEVTKLMTEVTGTIISYNKINPILYYFNKRKQGMVPRFAVVMTLLHFLPRFQSEPQISENYKMLTGKNPTTLLEFIEREKSVFI